MSKKKTPIPFAMRKHTLPKTENVRVEDLTKIPEIGQAGKDFIELGKANNVDFTAFFVMFNQWLHVPSGEKQAVILQLVKDGRVDLGDDVRKDNKDK